MHRHHGNRFVLALGILTIAACDGPASDLALGELTGAESPPGGHPPHPPHPPHPHDPDPAGSSDGGSAGAGSSGGGSSDGGPADAGPSSDGFSDGGGSTGGEDGPGGATTTGGDDGTTPPVDPPEDAFLDGFFPLGIFAPTAYAMQDWANIGCNTMLSVPQGHDPVMWDQTAQSLGLRMIRRPLGNGSSDIGREDLLAWLLPDEPDVEANNGACGGSCIDLVESWAAQWSSVDPSRKLFVNVAGPNVILSAACDYCNGPGDQPPNPACYPNNDQCYPKIIAAADWVSQDIYPVTGWLPSEQLRDDITVVGDALDRLRDWTDKPLFAIVEVADQRLGWAGTGSRGPTPAEYRAEVWHAIIHGARGIFYFPEAFNPFEFDNTEPQMRDEMAVQHGIIGDLAPILQGTIEPASVSATANAPLELTWRTSGSGDTWLFVLNTSPQSVNGQVQVAGATGSADVYGEGRTVSIVGGTIADAFAPYEVHIYAL